MSEIRDCKDLIAWQKGIDLAEMVYRVTRLLPPDERFGLVSQARRAAVSVPANIAEGFGRSGRADFVRFLDIALGSSYEVETHLLVSGRSAYLNAERLDPVIDLCQEVQRILKGLSRKLRESNKKDAGS